MASLKDIRRRISSVKNTQQITKAMKMVAAAKLRRAQLAIAGARPYAAKLEETSGRLVAEIMEGYASLDEAKQREVLSKLHPLLKMEAPKQEGLDSGKTKIALFVMASDRGLCGAYNTNVLRFGWKRHQELLQEGAEVSLFFAGKRAHDFFTKRGYPGHFFSDYWAGRFSTAKSDAAANLFIEKFLAGDFDRVEICFTHFKSSLTQIPELKQILPMSVPVNVAAVEKASGSAPFIYEPGRKEILASVLPKQVKTQVYRVAAESLASEFSAKLTAMDNATRNASEMIARLTLESNRVRQANITKELMEIIGGAEAIKG